MYTKSNEPSNDKSVARKPAPPPRRKPPRKPSDNKKNLQTLIGADDEIDEWSNKQGWNNNTTTTTSPSSAPILSPTRTRRFGYPSSPPPPVTKSKKKHKKHTKKSQSELPTKSDAQKKWKSTANKRRERSLSPNGQNLIIKINHIQKKHGTSKKKVSFTSNPQQQILGDILLHSSSYFQLVDHSSANDDNKSLWKTMYCILDQQCIQFYDGQQLMQEEAEKERENEVVAACITIYLSEILTLTRSIRSVDGEKYIIELNVCGIKVLLSFSNIEQREYWHSLLSDYHLNYFVWRSTPLDEHKRTSQNVINGVHKLLKKNVVHSSNKNEEMDTLNILYIEEILQKISALNITKIIDLVPVQSKFMAGRLIRVIMSIKFFFMSVLKSLSGADIPLPSRSALIDYLNQISGIKWEDSTPQILDFYCDSCYRILFSLSFAFTANSRDEIMRMTYKDKKGSSMEEKQLSELKFEYESLQRSWKMHRDRLQEYVMAYRDAVAKLKHSYHQRDSLCKKIDSLTQEKEKLNDSMLHQNKTFHATMQEAQKLTEKFALLSQQMDNMPYFHQQPIIGNYNQYQINNNNTVPSSGPQYQFPQYARMQQQSAPIFNTTMNDNNKNSNNKQKKQNGNNPRHQMQQISQEMNNLFNIDSWQ